MPRIETVNEKEVLLRRAPSGVPEMTATLGREAQGLADLAISLKQAEDTTKANRATIEYQRKTTDLWADYKQNRQANPEGMADDFDKEMEGLQANTIKTSGVGRGAAESLDLMLSGEREKLYSRNLQTENQYRVANYATQVDAAAADNNVIAYRKGQDLDLEAFADIDKNIETTLIAGSTLVDKAKLEEERVKQVNNAYTNWIEGAIESNPEDALELIDSGLFDEKVKATEIISLSQKAVSTSLRNEAREEKKLKQTQELNSSKLYMEAYAGTLTEDKIMLGLSENTIGSKDAVSLFKLTRNPPKKTTDDPTAFFDLYRLQKDGLLTQEKLIDSVHLITGTTFKDLADSLINPEAVFNNKEYQHYEGILLDSISLKGGLFSELSEEENQIRADATREYWDKVKTQRPEEFIDQMVVRYKGIIARSTGMPLSGELNNNTLTKEELLKLEDTYGREMRAGIITEYDLDRKLIEIKKAIRILETGSNDKIKK